MNIVVTDANILIDLCELDILEEFFSLPYSMSVVGAVWDELSDEQQQMYTNYLDDGRFSLVHNNYPFLIVPHWFMPRRSKESY